MTQQVQRYRDWQSRLAGFVASRESAPFVWGSNDCALFMFDAIEAMTGYDPVADLRDYSSELGAARILKRKGGMRGLAKERLGAEIHPMQAQVGDVGLVDVGGRESFALCGGSFWLSPGPNGLVRLDLGVAVMAWRCF